MPLSLKSHRLGVATASLGMNAIHTLETRFAALRKAGFAFCEVGFGDYIAWVRSQSPHLCPFDWGESGEPDPEQQEIWTEMYRLAPHLIETAKAFGLQILMLQPLNQFDGWPVGHPRRDWARRKAELWLRLCSSLRVEMVQVGSNNLHEANAPDETRAGDLRWLADFASKLDPPVKIAYEQWCFGEVIATWERCWEIVKLADHPNLGLCLDTGQVPLSPTYGFKPSQGGGFDGPELETVFRNLASLPKEKIFYLEISDVLPPVVPLGRGSAFDGWHNASAHGRNDVFSWVICARALPFIGKDAGRDVHSVGGQGRGRVLDTLRAILSTGFEGPVMMEMFEAPTMERPDPEIPYIYADACQKSIETIEAALGEA